MKLDDSILTVLISNIDNIRHDQVPTRCISYMETTPIQAKHWTGLSGPMLSARQVRVPTERNNLTYQPADRHRRLFFGVQILQIVRSNKIVLISVFSFSLSKPRGLVLRPAITAQIDADPFFFGRVQVYKTESSILRTRKSPENDP